MEFVWDLHHIFGKGTRTFCSSSELPSIQGGDETMAVQSNENNVAGNVLKNNGQGIILRFSWKGEKG